MAFTKVNIHPPYKSTWIIYPSDIMANRTTTIIAIAVAAVVVIAGAAIIIANNNPGKTAEHGASALQIRGNANDDMTINNDDMVIVDKIIAGEATLDDYPLADVNNDNTVDQTDKDLLKDIIDRKNGCDVYVICLDVNGQTTTQKVKYPIRNVATYGTNVQMPTLYANGGQFIAGYFSSSYDVAEGSINSEARDFGASARSITPASWTAFTKLDADLESVGGIGALIFDYSGINTLTETYQNDIKDGGIPLLIFSSADASSEITTVLTLGFLFGGDCEKMGTDYATASWDIINEIADKTVNIKDKDKTTFIGCTMYIYICQNESTFASSGITAGGMPYYKTNSDFAEKYAGKNSVVMSSVEALSNYKDIGAILNNRSMDWGLDPTEYKKTIIDSWTHDNAGVPSTEYFKGFENKIAYIDNLLPGAVKVAYMAHRLYDDRFSLDYANDKLMKFINLGTLPLKGQTLDTIVPYIDNTIYERASSSSPVNVGNNSVDMLYSLYKNYNGPYKTGAADATYAFAYGSNESSATLSVANTNVDPENNKNTFTVKVASDAKTAYTVKYSEYSALTSAETDPYTAATINSDFYSAYACYLNKGGVGIAHITGYVHNVVFDCYLYEPYDITNNDLQALVTAMYAAITNPVAYDGPEIPDESTGAKLVALLIAGKQEYFTVSSTPDASETEAAIIFATKNGMGSPATNTIPIKSTYDISEYNTAAAAITAMIGTEVSTGKPGTYAAYTEDIGDVTYTAVYGHAKDPAKYKYLYFVMRSGNILIDCSDTRICVYPDDPANVEAAVLSFMTDLASAVSEGSYKGAELVGRALVSNNSAMWELSDLSDPSTASTTVVFKTKGAKGSDTTFNVEIVSNSGIATAYTDACTAVAAHDDELVSSKGSPTQTYDAYDVDLGITYSAMVGHIPTKAYTYMHFAMKSSTTLIDCSNAKLSLYNESESDLSDAVDAFFAEVAAAMLL